MTRVACDVSMSVDGFAAGPNQSLDAPIGQRGARLHRWMFEESEQNADVIESITNAGAYVMGRNMWDLGRFGRAPRCRLSLEIA